MDILTKSYENNTNTKQSFRFNESSIPSLHYAVNYLAYVMNLGIGTNIVVERTYVNSIVSFIYVYTLQM